MSGKSAAPAIFGVLARNPHRWTSAALWHAMRVPGAFDLPSDEVPAFMDHVEGAVQKQRIMLGGSNVVDFDKWCEAHGIILPRLAAKKTAARSRAKRGSEPKGAR